MPPPAAGRDCRRTVVAVVLVSALATVSACAAGGAPAADAPPQSAPPQSAPPQSAPPQSGDPPGSASTAVEVTGTTAPAADVATRDLPDPSILRVGDTYYAYATGSGYTRVQVFRSKDLRHWEERPDAMVEPPAWADDRLGSTWAPTVTVTDDEYVLFVSVRDRSSGRMCIAQARAAAPEGPFRSANVSPMLCQLDRGGSIDPEVFRDRTGETYLLWKSDGNCCGQPAGIWAQRLGPDLRGLEGVAVQLVRSDQRWQGGVVEGPTVVAQDDRYVLLFSGNDWRTDAYAMGYATCRTMTGPCTVAAGAWLATGERWKGPGGGSVVSLADGSLALAFHSWTTGPAGERSRSLTIGRMTLSADGSPSVAPW